MVVFVEQTVMDDTLLINNPGFSVVKEKLMTFRDGKDDLTDKIDFIICLGGDGTLLYASLLFQVGNPHLHQYQLVCHVSHMDLFVFEPGPLWWEAGV
jgi:NAD+ kinase